MVPLTLTLDTLVLGCIRLWMHWAVDAMGRGRIGLTPSVAFHGLLVFGLEWYSHNASYLCVLLENIL